jgi:hypothetical protein
MSNFQGTLGNANGVPVQGNSPVSNQGTPNPQGVPQGTPQPGGEQPTVEELLSRVRKQEQDINNLKSSYDRRNHENEVRLQQQLEATKAELQRAVTSGMDETQKTKYEAEMFKKQAEEARQQLEEYRRSVQEQQVIQEAAQAFMQLGIPANRLDLSSQEALAQSGGAAVAETMEQLRRQTPAPVQPQSPVLPQQFQRPTQPVMTSIPGQSVPSQPVTVEQMAINLTQQLGRTVTPEEVFQRLEKGQLDPKSVR